MATVKSISKLKQKRKKLGNKFLRDVKHIAPSKPNAGLAKKKKKKSEIKTE